MALHPEGDGDLTRGSVDVLYTGAARAGETERVEYDYLINATGPKLNFAATPGLGPDGHSLSVCTAKHAELTADAFSEVISKLEGGERQTLVIRVGHGTCTCEGAAFEYAFNVEHELRARGLRERAEITSDVFAPSGFLKVDANYTPKPFEEWRAEDWPRLARM